MEDTQPISKKRLVQSRWIQILQELIRNATTAEEIHAIADLLRESDSRKAEQAENSEQAE